MDVSKINLEVDKVDSTSQISAGQLGQKNLSPGVNRFYIDVVAAASGLVRTYQIVINRVVPENLLLTLTTNRGTLSPTPFSPTTNEYHIRIEGEAESVTLTGTVSDRATVAGLGEITLSQDITKHSIIVTGYDGSVNTYTVNITKNAEKYDSNTNLTSLVPSRGTLSPAFSNSEDNYTITVDDGIGTMSFTAVPESNKTTVTGTNIKALQYGNTTFTIVVTPEIGLPRTITVVVTRTKSLQEITTEVPEITLNVNETHQLTYTLVPADAVDNEVEFEVDDSSIATVSNTGLVTAVGPGMAIVNIKSKTNNSIYATVVVNVVSSLITSDTYTIVRYTAEEKLADPTLVDYVIGFDPKTSFSSILGGFDNDSATLFLYNSSDILVTNADTKIGTGSKIKLKIGDTVYDELKIIVRGDINGDGSVTAADNNALKSYLNKVSTFNFAQQKAADSTKDSKLSAADINKLKSFLNKQISSLN